MRKPNIVWLTTDHQAFTNHYHYQPQFEGKLAAYERLASEGRTYEEAYSVCPLCTPARASMVSGGLDAAILWKTSGDGSVCGVFEAQWTAQSGGGSIMACDRTGDCGKEV